MLRSAMRICCLFLLACIFFLPTPSLAAPSGNAAQKEAAPAFPAVDPQYVYNQLFYMGTHFLRREAGYDNNLPPTLNGHDEFAAYWTQEIMHNLQGFGAQMRRDALTYHWDFGDGSSTSGVSVQHTYTTAGNYILTLTVTAPGGKRIISKTLNVTAQTSIYANPFSAFHPTGYTYVPRGMPTPDDRLTDKVSPASLTSTTSAAQHSTPTAQGPAPNRVSSNRPLLVGIGAVIVLLALILLIMARRKKPVNRS